MSFERKYMRAELNMQEMILRQMGADVEVINSYMCYVKFYVEGTKISYVYNVHKKNKYFLERIEPYSQVAGTFNCEEDVVEIIKIDLEQFKIAKKSKVFDYLVDINKEITNVSREFEDLYLYYNVHKEHREAIMDKIKEIHNIIIDAKKENERVFFKKDPDAL